ncbi:hypothetical protein BCR37DRAFT_380752 [Protomyces lactucae-debilis]|uniref:Uncharacterized protein n=1 Tax=Protomyces lactucae-debilis TaxID=2754530 RepID=A0A1Y2FDG2_PROLT|nr:uncharacterized protein BCR37DRAFT_380752 [Protomyces lactucae-debilis]ORY80895.1 hypothetical protein BCR37DRAFT_380752 [Protomyces lactucae-debilis]
MMIQVTTQMQKSEVAEFKLEDVMMHDDSVTYKDASGKDHVINEKMMTVLMKHPQGNILALQILKTGMDIGDRILIDSYPLARLAFLAIEAKYKHDASRELIRLRLELSNLKCSSDSASTVDTFLNKLSGVYDQMKLIEYANNPTMKGTALHFADTIAKIRFYLSSACTAFRVHHPYSI